MKQEQQFTEKDGNENSKMIENYSNQTPLQNSQKSENDESSQITSTKIKDGQPLTEEDEHANKLLPIQEEMDQVEFHEMQNDFTYTQILIERDLQSAILNEFRSLGSYLLAQSDDEECSEIPEIIPLNSVIHGFYESMDSFNPNFDRQFAFEKKSKDSLLPRVRDSRVLKRASQRRWRTNQDSGNVGAEHLYQYTNPKDNSKFEKLEMPTQAHVQTAIVTHEESKLNEKIFEIQKSVELDCTGAAANAYLLNSLQALVSISMEQGVILNLSNVDHQMISDQKSDNLGQTTAAETVAIAKEADVAMRKNQLLRILQQVPDPKMIVIKSKMKSAYLQTRSNRGSRYRGVSKNGKKWQVMIVKGIAKKYMGAISSELGAAHLYDKYALIIQGFQAKTNFSYTKEELIALLNEVDELESEDLSVFFGNQQSVPKKGKKQSKESTLPPQKEAISDVVGPINIVTNTEQSAIPLDNNADSKIGTPDKLDEICDQNEPDSPTFAQADAIIHETHYQENQTPIPIEYNNSTLEKIKDICNCPNEQPVESPQHDEQRSHLDNFHVIQPSGQYNVLLPQHGFQEAYPFFNAPHPPLYAHHPSPYMHTGRGDYHYIRQPFMMNQMHRLPLHYPQMVPVILGHDGGMPHPPPGYMVQPAGPPMVKVVYVHPNPNHQTGTYPQEHHQRYLERNSTFSQYHPQQMRSEINYEHQIKEIDQHQSNQQSTEKHQKY